MIRLSEWLRREWLSLILGGILAGLVLNCVYGPLGPRDLLALRRDRGKIIAKRDALLAENAQLKTTVAKLRSDKLYVQQMIRRELGYSRADEFVYRFRDTQHNSNP
jgi:cell division protein FtsB